MKGFPNQVNDLGRLAAGMRCLLRLVGEGANARDDGLFGEELVRAGVAGTGHRQLPVEEYLRQQGEKPLRNQSHRATARGLRELYRLLGFIDDSGPRVEVTDLGRQAAAYTGPPANPAQLGFWREAVRNIAHEGGGQTSHPYQVLLRLVEQKPGITRAKCALALEARNDSPEELARIVALADLPEEEIPDQIGATQSNWDNAKKVLPAFAEQLGDVVRQGEGLYPAGAMGRVDEDTAGGTAGRTGGRAARAWRDVTPETIATAGTADRHDEIIIPPEPDPEAAEQAIRLMRDRLRRHNLLVKELAGRFRGARLAESLFDLLVQIDEVNILVEVKTLDGTEADERDRVRDALGQLLYYEAFAVGGIRVSKVACLEQPISAAHREWLNSKDVAVIWKSEDGFAGDALAADILGDYIEELR
jgi:hypothetical protein